MDQQLGLKIETDLKNWAQISHKALRVGFFLMKDGRDEERIESQISTSYILSVNKA